MKKQQRELLWGSGISFIGALLLAIMFWMIWLSTAGAHMDQTMCGGLEGDLETCKDWFIQGKIIFSFLLPFFIFLPVGFIINATTKKQGEWVCKRKWVLSTWATFLLFVGFVGTVMLNLSYAGKFILGLLMVVAVSTLLSTAWTVFFHNRSHLFKR